MKPIKNTIKAGDVFRTNDGGSVTVVQYISARKVTVKNNDENGHVSTVQATQLRLGRIKNPYRKSVFGVGYFGSGKYKSRKLGKQTAEYICWKSMLQRCYDKKLHALRPSYASCSVCPEWHNFQVFAEWFCAQALCDNYTLDKDLIVRGNKIYSPDTVSIIPERINCLLLSCSSSRGSLPIGVTKSSHGYQASLNAGGKNTYIGHYSSHEDAFKAYKKEKEKLIKETADLYRDVLDDRVYLSLMSYDVGIDD